MSRWYDRITQQWVDTDFEFGKRKREPESPRINSIPDAVTRTTCTVMADDKSGYVHFVFENGQWHQIDKPAPKLIARHAPGTNWVVWEPQE